MEYPKKRILSIDVFRGFTIFIMIFVNDIASHKNIPAWMKHVPENFDGMTFVDLVFPAFLFIVGMAIPFALDKRKQLGENIRQIWKHIFIRSFGLLVLGFYMVNMHAYNETIVGMNKSLWILLVYIGAILVWNSYPKSYNSHTKIFIFLRVIGVILLISLAIIYRGGSNENLHWMQTGWWGILGLIGWAYLASCLVYLFSKKNLAIIIGIIALLTFLYIGDKGGHFSLLNTLNEYIWLAGHVGSHASITLSGIVVSLLLRSNNLLKNKIISILIFSSLLYLSGILLRPLYGISKITATPSWCLISSSICCLIFIILYWIVDVKNINRWTNFLKPAGINPLLAYIMPGIFYSILSILGINFLNEHLNSGIPGIFRSIFFTFMILAITNLFTKLQIKLHL